MTRDDQHIAAGCCAQTGGAASVAGVRPAVADYFIQRAERIHRQVLLKGMLQVRWCDGNLWTFKFPAPKGYGARGQLLGVYSAGVAVEWIEQDLLEFARTLDETWNPPRY